MAFQSELLEILRCPATRQRLKPLSEEQRQRINALIAEHSLKYADGAPVDQPLQEGLITEDGRLVYRVDEGIPVLLREKGIPVHLETGS